jgi:hypothetical protein
LQKERNTELAYKTHFRDINSLIPYARNARKHSQENLDEIARSMIQWGWTVPGLIDENGGIIAGHGRILAAAAIYARGQSIKLPNGDDLPIGKGPFVIAKGWSEEQKAAYVLADNRLAEKSTWDADILNFELVALDAAGFDIGLTGFDSFGSEGDKPTSRKSEVREVIATGDLEARFWISLRGPLDDQARVLDAIKKALGAPGLVEIDTGVIT